jgi:SAM-dependent methyltransferase
MNKEHGIVAPSEWVVRWAPQITHGTVLDVASGAGRHAWLFLQRNLKVTAIDREPQHIPGTRVIQADIENGPWPLPGERFEGIVVTNYLHRPLFPVLKESLAEGGVLIYETFMAGNERFGRPSNPAFLLEPGELRREFAGLQILGFEEGEVVTPKPSVIQRLCAVRGQKV